MKASKAPSTGYCGIPALSISSLEASNGLLWMAARATAGNPHVWEVSTAWDRATRTQDEVKVQLGIHSDVGVFTPQFYVASSSIYGVTAIAKRMAIGNWEHSPKSAEVVMMNILLLPPRWVLSFQVVRRCLWSLLMEVFCFKVMICITLRTPALSLLKKASNIWVSTIILQNIRWIQSIQRTGLWRLTSLSERVIRSDPVKISLRKQRTTCNWLGGFLFWCYNDKN